MYGLTEQYEEATKQVTCRDRLAEGASAACCKAKYQELGNQWMPDIGVGREPWDGSPGALEVQLLGRRRRAVKMFIYYC